MATIQIRNLDDDVYDRMAKEASRQYRSIEGEARYTLTTTYPESPLSLREVWQKEAGQRIKWVFEKLREDGWFHYGQMSDPVSLAHLIGEPSPAALLDCLDGNSGPTFDMASRMEKEFSCNANWIMSGNGEPFRTTSLGGQYASYFTSLLNETGSLDEDNELHFVRYSSKNQFDGTLLIIHRAGQAWECRYEYNRFCLSDNMGGQGRNNLFNFLKFVKLTLSEVNYKSWIYHDDTDAYPAFAHHHPSHYILDMMRSEKNEWLQCMQQGNQPQGWTMNFNHDLNKLKQVSTSQSGVSDAPMYPHVAKLKTRFMRQLVQTLDKYHILCESWSEFEDEFIKRQPTGIPNSCIALKLLGTFHVFDNLNSLHNPSPEDVERRKALKYSLQEENDFSSEEAIEFIETISVRALTASDFIRAMAENNVRCSDEKKFVSKVNSSIESKSPDSNPVANNIISVALGHTFYFDDKSGTLKTDKVQILEGILQRDFCFTEEQMHQFMNMIKSGKE